MSNIFEMQLGGRTLTVETGKLAQMANGACTLRYGDTVLLVTATNSAKPKEGIDFFPLSVDFEEKLYSAGKIPGSFIRREGKPSEKAILTSRLIDRPIRPLFPKGYRNDVQVVATVLSVDIDHNPDTIAMIGSSVALSISSIPFNGPTGSVSVGLVDDQFIINPTFEQREKSDMYLVVSGTKDAIMMVEAGSNEVSEEVMLNAILFAHEEIKKICDFVQTIANEIGKEKDEYYVFKPLEEVEAAVTEFASQKMKDAIKTVDKQERQDNMEKVKDETMAHFEEIFPENMKDVDEVIYSITKKEVRNMIVKDKVRPDNRAQEEIRPIWCEAGVLPRTHGSAIFTRGQTQICNIVTLAPLSEAQKIDGLNLLETTKRYIHQYNFPSYSVGETRPSRGPGRREIGHGALAERALIPVLPTPEEFPYAIRSVSETFESNGSTSMASTCSSCMALMAAGVPIKRMVAGISCGLVTGDSDDDYVLLTDIQGLEDFFGDMDFKVTGTDMGITAIQMDIKIHGLTQDIVKGAIAKCHEARDFILNTCMRPCISEPRKEISKYAPKIAQIQINPSKIGDVVGKQGKTINKIIEDTGVKIDISEEGLVSVAGTDQAMIDKAIDIIRGITIEIEAGMIMRGTVVRMLEFGAFVELAPGKDGMVHISKLSDKRVEKVEDVVKVGNEVTVKVIKVDPMKGRIDLSMKTSDLI